jgi:hypothetical protein
MCKITPLMTSLHEGHKAEERLRCIDNMLFNKCEDTKDTILQAFWWYRKHSIPLNKVELAKDEIEQAYGNFDGYDPDALCEYSTHVGEILDKLIVESEGK